MGESPLAAWPAAPVTFLPVRSNGGAVAAVSCAAVSVPAPPNTSGAPQRSPHSAHGEMISFCHPQDLKPDGIKTK